MRIKIFIYKILLLSILGGCFLAKPAFAFWGEFAAVFVFEGAKYFIESYEPDSETRDLPDGSKRAVPWKVCVEIPGDDRLIVHPIPDWKSPNIGVLIDNEKVVQIDEGYAINGVKWAKILYKSNGIDQSGWVNKNYLAHPLDDFANCYR